MAFKLPDLPYAYDALEPYIDARTMEIHHTKHHGGYTNNLNKAIAGTEMDNMTIEQILAMGVDKLPTAVRNNGGGYANHSLFWQIMSPNGGGEPTGALADALNAASGSDRREVMEMTEVSISPPRAFGGTVTATSTSVYAPDASVTETGVATADQP